ncbi:MAG: hypothetical protein ABI178_00780 [Rhodanobacter sp.]
MAFGQIVLSVPEPSAGSVTADHEPAQFHIARTCGEVQACWRLVYRCYMQKDLIHANRFAMHTTPQALNHDTAVVFGKTAGRIDTTLTVIPDGPHGLPLDKVYPQLLANLRHQGRRLVETGLLAGDRGDVGQGVGQAFGTMRLAFYRALHTQSDIVIGVHPRHADFYVRMLGFEVIGPLSSHPTVTDHPVVPLLLEPSRIRRERLPRLLRHIRDNPVEASLFDHRFDFHKSSVASSDIERYLHHATHTERTSHQYIVQAPATVA